MREHRLWNAAKWLSALSLITVISCGGSSEAGNSTSTKDSDGTGGTDGTAGSDVSGDGDGDGDVAGDGDGDVAGDGDGDVAGGDADGGASGGVMNPFTPNPAVADDCDALCEKLASADCPNGNDPVGCSIGCNLASSNPDCADVYGDLFTCAETADAVCNDNGEPQLDGCAVEQVGSTLCVLTSTDDAVKEPCSDYCAVAVTAGCEADQTQSDCEVGCGVAGSFVPDCQMLWLSYIDCGAHADSFSCNMDGSAQPDGCASEGLLYWACMLEAFAGTQQ